MALFAMADTHLSIGEDKKMDKFYGWENYEQRIREHWLAIVKPEDTVVINITSHVATACDVITVSDPICRAEDGVTYASSVLPVPQCPNRTHRQCCGSIPFHCHLSKTPLNYHAYLNSINCI